MSTTEYIIEKAERQCKQNGSKLTVKRKQVLTGLLESKKALSAYELADFCNHQYGNSMPAMSIYRILEFLKQEELVHELKLANKYVACSHITCDHAHSVSQFLICGECQSVKEVSVSQSTMEDLELTVNKSGYKLVSPQIEMNCICDQCSGHLPI